MSLNNSDKDINSILKLPYKLIDISDGTERFVLSFKEFDKGQTGHSIKKGGVTGSFEVTYRCSGIDSRFECDVTVGNLYYFYIELENVYECLPGTEPAAVLTNYGTTDRTDMTFRFDGAGHCQVSGRFMDKENGYKSGVIFDICMDVSYIYDILGSLKEFFDELKRIQGHGSFY